MIRAAEIEAVLRRAQGALSAREIHRDLRLPTGKPTAVNSVLYGNPDKFVSQGSAPPLWRLSERRAAVDLDDLLTQIERIAAQQPVAAGSAETWDDDFDDDDQPEPCPPQTAPPPSYGITPFQLPWPSLTAGLVADMTWPVFAKRLAVTVDAQDFDEIVLAIPDAVARAARDLPPVEIHVERIIDVVPYWVAWFIDADEDVLLTAQSRSWHIWTLDDPAAWDDRDALIHPDETSGVDDYLITWRSPSPLGLVRAIGGLLYDGCGLRHPAGLELQIARPPADEIRRREREVVDRERERQRLGRVWKGFKNPVAGACSICGQPLRDPLSVRRGIGPHCWQRYSHLGLSHTQMRADLPARFWVGCKPVNVWRTRFPASG